MGLPVRPCIEAMIPRCRSTDFNPISPPDLIANAHSPMNIIIQRIIHDIHELITKELKVADGYMKHDAARKTNHNITFKGQGERVWLSTEHLTLHNQPSKRFQKKNGPMPESI